MIQDKSDILVCLESRPIVLVVEVVNSYRLLVVFVEVGGGVELPD